MAERRVQPSFIKSLIINAIIVGLPVLAFQAYLEPRRLPLDLSPARTPLRYAPVPVDCPAGTSCRVWAVRSDDRRVSGLSGLAIDGRRLLAISDSGMLVWLDPPGTAGSAAEVRPLPVVPGRPTSKRGRDSEAIASAQGGGWWIAFEQQHMLFRYDREFGRVVERRSVARPEFRPNRGVEALLVHGNTVVPIPESSGVSDAVTLPDGREATLERSVGARGFSGRVTGLGRPIGLPLDSSDNPEGITAAPLAGGGTRLWIVTDNDGARWRRTLLLALDLPPAAGD